MELGKPYVLFAWKPIPSDPLYMIPEGYLIQDDVVFPLNIDAGQLDYAGMPYKKFEAKVKAAITKNIDTD